MEVRLSFFFTFNNYVLNVHLTNITFKYTDTLNIYLTNLTFIYTDMLNIYLTNI